MEPSAETSGGRAASPSTRRARDLAAAALLLLALSQMLGDALGMRWLKGIGAASVAAPLPKVFSDVAGLETFASRFVLEVETARSVERREITPAVYARVSGPYNRRNVYEKSSWPAARAPLVPSARKRVLRLDCPLPIQCLPPAVDRVHHGLQP